MKFEMPKMNVAIFSCENIVTTSGGVVNPPAPAVKTNVELATEAVGTANVTVVTAGQWINA